MAGQRFYDQVAREIATQQLDKGLWVRAFSETHGDETKAKAAYIGLRVKQLEAEERDVKEKRKAEQKAEQVRREAQERAEKAAKSTTAMHQPARARETLNSEAVFYLLTIVGGLWILGYVVVWIVCWFSKTG